MSSEIPVCFYCHDDFFFTISDDEVSRLSEPYSDSETKYVLDNCVTTYQSKWDKECRRIPDLRVDMQNLQNNELSDNLSTCHRCGSPVVLSADD